MTTLYIKTPSGEYVEASLAEIREAVTWPFPTEKAAVSSGPAALQEACDLSGRSTTCELESAVVRLRIRCAAYENAYRIAYQATFQSHTGHWDKTGQGGRGCPECVRAREARENCDAALREGLAALIDRAAREDAAHEGGAVPTAGAEGSDLKGTAGLTSGESGGGE